MHDLFRRLFKRKLEDFLTEALVALLNRLSLAEKRRFVLDMLLAERTQSDLVDFKRLLQPAKLQWQSQRFIELKEKGHVMRGRPDMILSDMSHANGMPLVLVESKIDAAFTMLGGSDDEEEQDEVTSGTSLSQLKFYGRWLKSKNPQGALVLLTYKRKPEEGFLEEANKDFGVRLRAVSLWVTLSQWVSQESMPLKDAVTAFLRDQLRGFLIKEGICGMTIKDMNVLNRYLCARERSDEDEGILDAAELTLQEIMVDAARELEAHHPKYEYGAILSTKSSDNEAMSLRFGFISCPNGSWKVGSPSGLLACIIVFLDKGEGAELIEGLDVKLTANGWAKKRSDKNYAWWIRSAKARNFVSARQGFAGAFKNWARDELDEAENRISQGTKKVKAGKSQSAL